jgi:3'(2'), 5'-bisphosphate nucleotidase
MTADLSQELDFALKLASRAGELALEFRRDDGKHLDADEKPNDGGIVTAADLAVNELLVRAVRQRFPDDGVLAEESDADGDWATHRRVWMLDPIDGTREYSLGLEQWAVHIGLCVAGEPALGVVAMPARGRTLWGLPDEHRAGMLEGSSPSPISFATDLSPQPRMLTSASRHSPRMDALAEALAIPAGRRSRSGSSGVKMALLCEGEAELYPHGSGGLKLWDTCAPLAVLRACGGNALGLRGEPLRHDGSVWRHSNGLLAFRRLDGEATARLVAERFAGWFDDQGLTRE